VKNEDLVFSMHINGRKGLRRRIGRTIEGFKVLFYICRVGMTSRVRIFGCAPHWGKIRFPNGDGTGTKIIPLCFFFLYFDWIILCNLCIGKLLLYVFVKL